jgi:hypothetical protein
MIQYGRFACAEKSGESRKGKLSTGLVALRTIRRNHADY